MRVEYFSSLLMPAPSPSIHWLQPGQEFPDITQAWDHNSPAAGLLAAGGTLDVDTLIRAYRNGIFPWFSQGQPPLWWSPDPRMVLRVSDFRVHPSFKKTLQKFKNSENCEIRIDSAFEQVITACATTPRDGQAGTWILPDMVATYCALHKVGLAHSVETWTDGKMAGGLYCVALGRSVFGESMFSHASNASKIALAALVAFCSHHAIPQIDCQQNTRHLASLGAREISRTLFIQQVHGGLSQPAPQWKFSPLYWNELLSKRATPP